VIKLKPPGEAGGSDVKEWHSQKGFHGPVPEMAEPLDAWEKYAQVLLLSNEFMFVD